jgi:hypothetical protein
LGFCSAHYLKDSISLKVAAFTPQLRHNNPDFSIKNWLIFFQPSVLFAGLRRLAAPHKKTGLQ